MKRMIMAMVAVILMATSVSAQRINNAYTEARVLTEKMVEELGLTSAQREKAYQTNLTYMNGINSYADINSNAWKQRNTQLKSILTASQWKNYKKASYFYRPISWRNNAYVHNIYSKYPSARSIKSDNRTYSQTTKHATSSKHHAVTQKTQQPNNGSYNKNNVSYNKNTSSYNKGNGMANVNNGASNNKSFGNLRM